MTDPRRAEHPAPPGAPDAATTGRRPHVVVVGAGIAGLAAATALADRGVTVEVLERDQYLGGRVGGWSDTLPDGTGVAMNRGFHAFFRQYYNLRKMLARVDPQLSMLTPVDDYPLIDARGRRDTFHGLPGTPPLNAAGFRVAQPHISAAGPAAAQRPRCGATARRVGARYLCPPRSPRRRNVPAHHQLSRRRAASRVRGVLA